MANSLNEELVVKKNEVRERDGECEAALINKRKENVRQARKKKRVSPEKQKLKATTILIHPVPPASPIFFSFLNYIQSVISIVVGNDSEQCKQGLGNFHRGLFTQGQLLLYIQAHETIR